MCNREIFDKSGKRWFYITSFAGPWQVCHSLKGHWHIINTETKVTKKIGRSGNMRGVNYYDKACEECERRNTVIRNKLP